MFMNRRKGVAWLSGGCTLIFQTLLDFQIMAAMALIAAAVDRSSLIRRFWHIPAVILILLLLNMWFWTRGRPASALGKRIYDCPSLISFRIARPCHYVRLAGIRTTIFLAYGVMLYFQVRGFRVNVHPVHVFALLPAVLLVDGLPITPLGLGPVQAILVIGFAAYASRARLLAMALSISFMNIVFQAPLGLGSAGAFAREVAEADSLSRHSV
jgi:Lysylphosphatidylglycerol synthase TM region